MTKFEAMFPRLKSHRSDGGITGEMTLPGKHSFPDPAEPPEGEDAANMFSE
jgi:hypothetical protein